MAYRCSCEQLPNSDGATLLQLLLCQSFCFKCTLSQYNTVSNITALHRQKASYKKKVLKQQKRSIIIKPGDQWSFNRKPLSLCSFVASFKTIYLKNDFKHILNDFKQISPKKMLLFRVHSANNNSQTRTFAEKTM